MPHFILEYSDNISGSVNSKILFPKLHQLVCDVANAKIDGCKSRAYVVKDYWVGDGVDAKGFVYLQIQLLPGRTPEQLQALSDGAMATIKEHVLKTLSMQTVQLAVNISELSEQYAKCEIG